MRNIGVSFWMVLVILALYCNPVVAAEAPPANPVGEALAHLFQVDVVPILAALVTTLLGIVLDKLRKKFNLDISEKRQEQLNALAVEAIAIAEEKAAAALKTNATKLTGINKLDQAISYIIARAPRVSIEQADALVHSMLAKTHGVGATGKRYL